MPTTYDSNSCRWRCRVHIHGKRVHLGWFTTREEAEAAEARYRAEHPCPRARRGPLPKVPNRLLTNAEGTGLDVDHINGNTLDNRLENLRLVTVSGNNRNQNQSKAGSGYKGVAWSANRWRAKATHENKSVHIGRFHDVHEAGRAAHEWRARNWPTSPEARTPFVINPLAGLRET